MALITIDSSRLRANLRRNCIIERSIRLSIPGGGRREAIDKRETENLIITKMYLYRTVREN